MSLCAQTYSRLLRVQPTTPENKLKLVEEIKSRAKGCIGSRSFPVAIQLYTKAIDVLADGTDSAASAILRANRSMCYLSINNAALALEDASEAEKLDPTYIKTFYRKAAALKALGRFAEAKEAIQRGLHAKPDDKEMQGLLAKIESDLASKGSASSGSSAAAVKPARTTVKTGTAGSSSTTATKPSASANKGSETSSADNAEEDDDENLGNVRGYKKTADGRVTTFFNNDLDETAKKLIGDIAPKKLEAVAPSAAVATGTTNGTSVWNSAGTYEERQLSPWASAELKRSLGALAAHIASPGVPGVQSADLCVAEVENVTGDAQVTMVRGKKKHLADYCADIKWTLTALLQEGGKVDTISGRLQLLDISADQEYEVGAVEVTHYNGNAASLSSLPQHAGQLVTRYVKAGANSAPQGLQALAHAALMQFCADLKTK
jgi:tetratricopeptide (TPR) repeat protein